MRAPHLPAHCSVGGQEKEVGHSHLSELSASSNHLFRLPSALHRLPSALHRLPSAQAGIAQVTISAQVAICICTEYHCHPGRDGTGAENDTGQ